MISLFYKKHFVVLKVKEGWVLDFIVKNKAHLRPDRLQKCSRFGLKMLKSWLFEALSIPNHHRNIFLIHEKLSEISKVKRLNFRLLVKNEEMKKNLSPFYFAFMNSLFRERECVLM